MSSFNFTNVQSTWKAQSSFRNLTIGNKNWIPYILHEHQNLLTLFEKITFNLILTFCLCVLYSLSNVLMYAPSPFMIKKNYPDLCIFCQLPCLLVATSSAWCTGAALILCALATAKGILGEKVHEGDTCESFFFPPSHFHLCLSFQIEIFNAAKFCKDCSIYFHGAV